MMGDQETAAKFTMKPLQNNWHKVQEPERGEKLACAKTWGKTAAEKAKKQCQKYLLVYMDGWDCKKFVT